MERGNDTSLFRRKTLVLSPLSFVDPSYPGVAFDLFVSANKEETGKTPQAEALDENWSVGDLAGTDKSGLWCGWRSNGRRIPG